jgi:hypothetical protein
MSDDKLLVDSLNDKVDESEGELGRGGTLGARLELDVFSDP